MKKISRYILLAIIALALISTIAYVVGNGHSEHSHEENSTHEEHGSENSEEHNDHHEHNKEDDHSADTTSINKESAREAGIITQRAKQGSLVETTPLTGRVILNRNKTINIRGRFPGIVKSVHADLGDKIKKGQLLAKVESNESLQIYEIKSPSNGTILERDISAGDTIGDNSLFRIADLSNVWAEFHVFPKDLDRIQEGLPINVHTLNGKQESQTNIKLILPTADRLSQTVLAIAVLDNSQEQWKPGMMIEGDVSTREKKASVVIEKTALQILEGKQVVFVQEGETYTPRPVMVGLSSNKMVEILEGLKPEESYVSKGSFIIKADIGKESAEHSH